MTSARKVFKGSVSTFWRDRRGVSAIEFGIMAPLYLFIMAGIVDLGGAVFTKMRIDSAITAASAYTLTKGEAITESSATALATDLTNLIAGDLGVDGTTIDVTVNHGPNIEMVGAHAKKSGTDANASLCFCPQRTGNVINWGSAKECGTSCPGGGVAGKFVSISVDKSYTPLFPMYRFMPEDPFSGLAVIQAQ